MFRQKNAEAATQLRTRRRVLVLLETDEDAIELENAMILSGYSYMQPSRLLFASSVCSPRVSQPTIGMLSSSLKDRLLKLLEMVQQHLA